MLMPNNESFFLRGVENNRYGETGHQRAETKTVVDQYSLDHYLGQQWNVDIDNIHSSMNEATGTMVRIPRRFYSYAQQGNQQ